MNNENDANHGLNQDVIDAINELRTFVKQFDETLDRLSGNPENDSDRTKRRLYGEIARHIESCAETRDATLHH